MRDEVALGFLTAASPDMDSKDEADLLISCCAMVVVGGAIRQPMRRPTAMLIIGIILGFVGLGYLCWLIFALAVYALPLFAGITAGLAAYHSGSGPIAAIVVATIVSVIVLFAGQIAFRTLRSTAVRAAIGLVFALPAAVAGYHAAHGLAHLVVPIEAWRETMGIAGAVMVATIACARITLSATNDPSRA